MDNMDNLNSLNNIQKRILLYVFGCVGTRSLFVLAAAKMPLAYLPWLGYLAIIPAIGFALIYIGGLRKTGGEVFGETIWWDSLRPIHSILYFAFAYYAINKNKGAWKYLFADLIFGIIAFILYHSFFREDTTDPESQNLKQN
jgi:hypothetical protein